MNWKPTASLETLKQRAQLMANIRAFFHSRGVLEVETPLLSAGTVTDLHLEGFSTQFVHPLQSGHRELFLQTSPEYAMKRLLSAGSGAIFQLCKAFRNEEAGRFHNPEFTMLEWYRPGFDHVQLMAEVDELMQKLVGCPAAEIQSYQGVFLEQLQFDPLDADLARLKSVCQQHGYGELAEGESDPDTLLQLLFSTQIEPKIGQSRPILVHSFPASQAALAKLDPSDPRVARRFELYYKGVELANGFHELQDPQEQADRFAQDNRKRIQMGRAEKPVDEHLLAALGNGLPDCAGVALGVDRLLMLILAKEQINQVVSFSIDNA